MENQPHKKLFRSRTNKQVAGVCGGLAEYMHMDVTVIRLIWIVILLVTGIVPGLIAYIIFALVVPLEPEHPVA